MDNNKISKRLTDEAKIIGANLRYLREAVGLSQHEVASFLNVSYQQIQKYEAGQNRIPVEKLFHLKNFYDVPYEIFFRDMMDADIFKDNNASVYVRLMGMQDKGLKKRLEQIILLFVDYE